MTIWLILILAALIACVVLLIVIEGHLERLRKKLAPTYEEITREVEAGEGARPALRALLQQMAPIPTPENRDRGMPTTPDAPHG